MLISRRNPILSALPSGIFASKQAAGIRFPAAHFCLAKEECRMAMIKVEHLSFSYPGSYDLIFNDVSFQIDTDWKLGFVGRNVPRYEQKTLSIT